LARDILFANLCEYLLPEAQNGRVELELPADTTPADLIERHRQPPKFAQLVLLDGHYIDPDKRGTTHLNEGDVLVPLGCKGVLTLQTKQRLGL